MFERHCHFPKTHIIIKLTVLSLHCLTNLGKSLLSQPVLKATKMHKSTAVNHSAHSDARKSAIEATGHSTVNDDEEQGRNGQYHSGKNTSIADEIILKIPPLTVIYCGMTSGFNSTLPGVAVGRMINSSALVHLLPSQPAQIGRASCRERVFRRV